MCILRSLFRNCPIVDLGSVGQVTGVYMNCRALLTLSHGVCVVF